ncbi:MAG: hypothetical protein VB012_03945 [Erysipelotrichaceae bacterium]|nr:hypothetical protein [Erysipelotrichaceae bacterium]
MICFNKKHYYARLSEFFIPADPICNKCREAFIKSRKLIEISGLTVESLYVYNEAISQLFIQYKELFDEALAPIFLHQDIRYLRKKYRGFTLVPVPSRLAKVEERGFDHVSLMFKSLRLPIVELFANSSLTDQKKQRFQERQHISEHISFKDSTCAVPHNILLIDDIMTTGASLQACYSLLKRSDRQIKALTVAGQRQISKGENKYARKSKMV